MMMLIKNIPTLMTPEKAEAIAARLNDPEDDCADDWTYVVRHDPKGTGYSLIDIFDEDNILIGQI